MVLLKNRADDVKIERDPVASLTKFLEDNPEWSHHDAHVFWKQDGWKHLEKKDYMISSFQVACFGLPLILSQTLCRDQDLAGCMQSSFCNIFSSSRGVVKPITRRFDQTVALGCCLTYVSGRHP